MPDFRHAAWLAALGAASMFFGCGDDDGRGGGDPDAGTTPMEDGGTTPMEDGGGEADLCAEPRGVTLEMGEQVVTGDTTGASDAFALAEGCGDPEGAGPTEVFALTLPGTGLKGVSFSLLNATTTWDTVVEIRPDGCDATTNTQCFDDAFAAFGIVQSVGSFTAEGGSTVYLVLTGYGDESGAYEMSIEVQDATAPTFDSGDAYRVGTERYDLVLTGSDSEGDAAGARLVFLDGDGAAIGVDADEDPATPDQTEFQVGFERVSGEPDFEGLIRIADEAFVTATDEATQVEVTVLDQFLLESATMTLDITDVTEAGLGESCGTDAICADGFECTGATCVIPPEVVTACAAADPIVVTPDAATVTESVSGSLDAGDGLAFASCGDTSGAENFYTVTVPGTGTYDLIASTDNEATGDADTVVYIRTTCGDPGTEVACNDDAGEDFRSTAVVEAAASGTYTIAVEMYGGAEEATAYQLDVSLRPVLGADEACDPTSVMNRCATGPCPDSGEAVCPPAT